jgi:hypothetical protein
LAARRQVRRAHERRPELIEAAVDCKADLAGVTFHVGSQCLNPENWRVGMERARKVFASMRSVGLKPRLLNLGGGYPVRHVKPIPSIETIADLINKELRHFGPEIQVIAEPAATWCRTRATSSAASSAPRPATTSAGCTGTRACSAA